MAVRSKPVRWRRVVVIDLVLIAAWLFTVVGFWRLVDLVDVSEHRAMLAAEVRAATGRELVLSGAAELTISLEPTITINDVAFENAAWGSQPWMVTAARIEAQVRLVPLLFGRLEIKRVSLIEPEILIETSADGVGNWQMAMADTPGDAAQDGSAVTIIPAIRHVVLEGGHVTIRDGKAGTTSEIIVERLTAQGSGIVTPLSVEAIGRYDDIHFSLEGVTGSVAALSGDAPFPVKLAGEIDDIRIAVEGQIGQPLAGRQLDVRVAAEGDSFLALSRRIGWNYPEIGSYRAAFRLLDGADGSFRIAELTAELGNEDEEFVSISGSIANALEGTGLNLEIELKARTLERIGDIFDLPLAPAGPVVASGVLRDHDGVHVVENAAATVGESDAAGKVTIDRESGRLLLVIEAASEFLDAAYLAGINPPEPPGLDDRLFSDSYLYLDQLGVIDLVLALQAKRLRFHQHRLEDVTLDLSMERGKMIARIFRARYFDGDLTGEIVVTPRRERPQVSIDFTLERMDFGQYLVENEITDLLEGRANVVVDVNGSGTDFRTIMGSLGGQAVFIMGDGSVNSAYVDFLAADLLGVIGVSASDETSTTVNCFVGMFDVAAGIATTDGFLFDTERMTVAGEGSVDLKEETLDLFLRPRPKDASLLSLATPLRVDGSLRDPSTAPDKLSIASTAATAVLSAIATGGFGAIVPFLSLGTGDESPCILATADPHSIAEQLDTTPDEAPSDRERNQGAGDDISDPAPSTWISGPDEAGTSDGGK